MGWIRDTFDLSLFNENSFQSSIGQGDKDGYAVIKIVPKFNRFGQDLPDPSVKGVIQENLDFSIEANYMDMTGLSLIGGVASKIEEGNPLLNGAASLLGATNQGYIFASKKIYSKSGYLIIKPKMRVLDWKGIGQPILSALLLAYYCLPVNNWDSINNDIENLKNKFKEQLKSYKDSENKIESIAATIGLGTVEAIEGATDLVVDFSKNVNNNVSQYVKDNPKYTQPLAANVEGIDNVFSYYSSPTPVKVTIGEFFYHDDMIIEGVSFNFSKECTKSGPLYVDIDINLSSRTIIRGIDNIGLKPSETSQIDRFVLEMGSDTTGL